MMVLKKASIKTASASNGQPKIKDLNLENIAMHLEEVMLRLYKRIIPVQGDFWATEEPWTRAVKILNYLADLPEKIQTAPIAAEHPKAVCSGSLVVYLHSRKAGTLGLLFDRSIFDDCFITSLPYERQNLVRYRTSSLRKAEALFSPGPQIRPGDIVLVDRFQLDRIAQGGRREGVDPDQRYFRVMAFDSQELICTEMNKWAYHEFPRWDCRKVNVYQSINPPNLPRYMGHLMKRYALAGIVEPVLEDSRSADRDATRIAALRRLI